MKTSSPTRFANALVSVLLTMLIAVHAAAGAGSVAFGVMGLPAWLAWAAVVLSSLHIALCTATSWQQLSDTVRPPSDRKKRHLALKWATGLLLVASAVIHLRLVMSVGPILALTSAGGLASLAALCASLAAHLCVGSKSLLKDLGVDRKWRSAVRVAACCFTVAVFAVVFWSVLVR